MKLVSYEAGGVERYGALFSTADGTRFLDLPRAFAFAEAKAKRPSDPRTIAEVFGANMLGFIERQARSLPALHELLAMHAAGALPETWEDEPLFYAEAATTPRAPLPRPPSVRDGYAFRKHVETVRKNRGLAMIPEFDEFPVFYFSNHRAITGPGDVAVEPLHLDMLDYELEAAIVIGRGGRNIAASQADAHVFGMMIMNDWSARGLQMQEMKLNLGPAKGKDFATSLGPWLVTMDELESRLIPGDEGARFDLAMTASVNDKARSAGNLRDMRWTFAEIVARASYGVSLFPGDVIGSGTVGTGCLLELNGSNQTPEWLRPGDRVELAIEGLGRLVNRVVLAGR